MRQELQKNVAVGKKMEKDNKKLKTTNEKLATSQAPSKKTQQQKAAKSIDLEEEDFNQKKSRRGGSSKKQIIDTSSQQNDTSLSVAIVVDAVLQAIDKKGSSSDADGSRELNDARQKQLQAIDQ